MWARGLQNARACSMKHGSSKKEPKAATTAPLRGISTGAPGRTEELLRAIIRGTAATTGTQFFRSLVRHLAQGLHVRFAFAAECLPNLRARSLAFFQDNDFGRDFEYALPRSEEHTSELQSPY